MRSTGKGKFILPAVVEISLVANESRVLEYAEVSKKQMKKLVEPLARSILDSIHHEMETGRFDELMEEYERAKGKP